MTNCLAYYRTSSVTNVGEDKDSLKRQKQAVEEYAKKNKLNIVREFYDKAVSGSDHIHERKGFAELLAYMKSNGAKTILIETANRFSRDTIVGLTGEKFLKDLGYNLVPVDAPNYFQEDTPTNKLIRSVLLAVSDFEKSSLVAKLRGARMRKKVETGRCEGRIGYINSMEKVRKEAKRLRRVNPVSKKQLSYNKIGKALFDLGFTTPTGKPLDQQQIYRLCNS